MLLYSPGDVSSNMVIYIYMVIYFTFSRPPLKMLPVVDSISFFFFSIFSPRRGLVQTFSHFILICSSRILGLRT